MTEPPRTSLETETKFDVDASFQVPDLTGVPGVSSATAPRTHLLAAVYFDTPDLRLAAARVTLRRRAGGPDEGWHLKTPVAPGSRTETHAPLASGTSTVPDQLAVLVADVTGGLPLRPVARLETSREVREVCDAAGRALAEIADDRVAGSVPRKPGPGASGVGGEPGWREIVSWREVEVELAAGSAELLASLGARLAESGARPSPAASKLGLVLAAAGLTPGTNSV